MEQLHKTLQNEPKESIYLESPIIGEIQDNSHRASDWDLKEDVSASEFFGVTKVIKKTPISKKKYQHITNGLRMKLIDAVENKNEKIKHAAQRLGINYSSAKSICQVFKSEGRTNRKTTKSREIAMQKNQVFSNNYEACDTTETQTTSTDYKGQDSISSEGDEVKGEKDTLQILRDRLLRSRASGLKDTSSLFCQQTNLTPTNPESIQSDNSSPGQSAQIIDTYSQNLAFSGRNNLIEQNHSSNSCLNNLLFQSPYQVNQNGCLFMPNNAQISSQREQSHIFQQPLQNYVMIPAMNFNQPQSNQIHYQTYSTKESFFNLNNTQNLQISGLGDFQQNSQVLNSLYGNNPFGIQQQNQLAPQLLQSMIQYIPQGRNQIQNGAIQAFQIVPTTLFHNGN